MPGMQVCPSSSGGSLLTLFPAPMRAPSHGRQSPMNFSNVDPSLRLQFFPNCSGMGPSRGCSPSATGCSSVGPLRLPSPASKAAPAWAFLSMGPHLSCCMGSQPPLGISLLRCGVPHGMQVDLSSTMTSVGCQVTSCLSMIFPMGCKGFSCPLFPTDLGSAGLFLSRSHSSAAAALAQQHSYSLQCYSRCTPTVADGLIHGQWWVHPGACWNLLSWT